MASQQEMQQAGQQLRAALDKIVQAKDNPQQIQQAVNDAKTKLDQLLQHTQGQQGGGQQGQQGGQQQR